MDSLKKINSVAEMIATIRAVGMIPFTKCKVKGWSIQEMTDPDYWFTTSDQLGPWDWKIEALHEGIIYGKYISRSSCFATEEMYRHLMNWRRSLPYYQMAEGGEFKATAVFPYHLVGGGSDCREPAVATELINFVLLFHSQ